EFLSRRGGWRSGGLRVLLALVSGGLVFAAAAWSSRRLAADPRRAATLAASLLAGFYIYRLILDPAGAAVEAINPALQGNLGGLGLPVLLSWPVGGLLAAGAGWLSGQTAVGLRSDCLAIATPRMAENVVALVKDVGWAR